MDVELEPGIYVLAVSGGVDSMVLLDILRQKSDYRLIVAHFDHGIRPDSHLDKQLIQNIASQHGLAFVHDRKELGTGVSEADARAARYEFLHKVLDASQADAIVTAHHHDDALETAVHNIIRGTKRKGASSLKSQPLLKRPLLKFTKQELIDYATNNKLKWREDATNTDIKYRRNFIRQKVLPKLSPAEKKKLEKLLEKMNDYNQEIDELILSYLKNSSNKKELSRKEFVKLPHAIALEIMAEWLRQNNLRQFDRKLLEKLVVSAKTLKPGKTVDIYENYKLKITTDKLSLVGSV